jgi:hypothetical protein
MNYSMNYYLQEVEMNYHLRVEVLLPVEVLPLVGVQ